MINESYYVPVNINYKKGTTLTGSVELSVLISETASATKIYTSLQQVQSDYLDGAELDAATIYFNNGGKKLLIFQKDSQDTDATTIAALGAAYTDFIWVSYVESKTVAEIEAIATALKSLNQQLPKFLAITTKTANAPADVAAEGLTNVALLYSTESTVTPYSAIVIPAYFSGIDLEQANSLKSIVHTVVTGMTDAEVTGTELTTLVEGNWNVIVDVAGRFDIIDGGKMCDGQPIHSAFGFALFKKDCENTVMDLLVQKLPYENSSNAVIENALTQICNRYVTNGLIGTQRIYNQPTQTVVYNGIQYTTIEHNQALTNGYYIYSIPISVATTSDSNVGRIPPIYIYAVINDVIRIVTITGEVSK